MQELRPYQVYSIEELKNAIKKGIKKIVLMLPTGGGKTKIAAEIAAGILRKGNKMAFTCPRIDLCDQTFTEFYKEGVEDTSIVQANNPFFNPSASVQICSLQTLERRNYFPDVSVVIFDEVHLLRGGIKKYIELYPNAVFIGLSATPWTKGLGDEFDTLIIGATMKGLISEGYLSPYRAFAPQIPDLKGIKIKNGDYDENQLSKRLRNDNQLTADIIDSWKKLHGTDRTLVFATNRAHAQVLQERFIEAGIPAGYQDAFTPPSERKALKEAFHSKEMPVLVSVETMIVGVDYDVRCISLCRSTLSEMLFCLDSKTEILTSNGWKGIGEINIGDYVAALDTKDGNGKWSRVSGAINRKMNAEEKWVSYDGPRSNFRVTDNHRMVFKASKSYWRIDSAIEAAKLTSGIVIPNAVTIETPGVPLTDHELYFIGMMMTDGTWDLTRGSISQSERHPEILIRIEEALSGCGIQYTKKKIPPPPFDAEIKQVFDRWNFNFSAGMPRLGNLHKKSTWELVVGKTGFRHLLPWLNKDFAIPLMSLSRNQFTVLLKGIHDGDGVKLKCPSVYWTPKSWTLSSARKDFVDRLQAVASINGFMSNSRIQTCEGKNSIYIITISPQHEINIGSHHDGRPTLEVKNSTDEYVWCIENEHGTIITRRNGKVTVMGNCQLFGRGTRLAKPGADPKPYLTFLDHSGTIDKLGRPEDIVYNKLFKYKDDETEPLPPKPQDDEAPSESRCPKCFFIKPYRTPICPSCGFKITPTSKVIEREGELTEITSDIPRQKKGAPKVYSIKEKAAFLADLKAYVVKRESEGKKYSPSFADAKFKDKFGTWPDKSIRDIPASPKPSVAIMSFVKYSNIKWAKGKKKRDTAPNA